MAGFTNVAPFECFGGTRAASFDNAEWANTKACVYCAEVQRSNAAHAEGYAFQIDACPPHYAQKQGLLESGIKYVEKSFVPLRMFRALSDSNQHLDEWIMQLDSTREHGKTREPPLARFASRSRC